MRDDRNSGVRVAGAYERSGVCVAVTEADPADVLHPRAVADRDDIDRGALFMGGATVLAVRPDLTGWLDPDDVYLVSAWRIVRVGEA